MDGRGRISLILACLLAAVFCGGALAEEPAVRAGDAIWEIRMIPSGTTADYDNDGATEEAILLTDVDEYGDGGFTLVVGRDAARQEYCCGLRGTVYAMKVGYVSYSPSMADYYYGTLFLVPEDGPSDDPYSYCYLFTENALIPVGGIAANPEDMICKEGVVTTMIRASHLGTWARPADFILARGTEWDEESGNVTSYYRLTEVPRELYPMGMIVTLKVSLPLMTAREDSRPSLVIPSGQKVVLVATDDARWLCVSPLNGEKKGWIAMEGDYMAVFNINGQEMDETEVFDGILYAD